MDRRFEELFRKVGSSANFTRTANDRKVRASRGKWKMHKPVNLGRLYFQRQLNVQGYQCSADLRYVLFKHNVKPVSNERMILVILVKMIALNGEKEKVYDSIEILTLKLYCIRIAKSAPLLFLFHSI